MARVWFKHQLRNDYFPGVARQAVAVLGLRTLSVPRHDRRNGGKHTAHAQRGLKSACQLSHDGSVAVRVSSHR